MKTRKIKLSDYATRIAMTSIQGTAFYRSLLPTIQKGHAVEIDMTGMRSFTSGFANTSIGRIVQEFPEARDRISFTGFTCGPEMQGIWQEKIDFAMGLEQKPALPTD